MFQVVMNNIRKLDNLEIINNNDIKIVRKKCKSNIIAKYRYLESKGFHNFIDTKIIDGYEIRDYIDEVDISKEDKLNELIYLISIMHTKTTHYKNISINEIKLFYEKTTDEINNIKLFYNKIVEDNDIYMFLKPSINYLIKNISIILISLDNCKFFLDKWYDIVKTKLRKRVVMNHNNLKLSNFIVGSSLYLINFDNSIIDYPIYDIVSIFKNNFKIIDMIDLFNTYSSKYSLLKEEVYLLFVELLKIEKIDFKEFEVNNTRKISDLILYLNRVSFFLENCMKTKK